MLKNCNSFLNFILITVLLFLLTNTGLAYSDINYTLPAKVAIESFTEQGILEGYDDGTFRPEKSINRAEAMKIITLVFPKENNSGNPAEKLFPDTDNKAWYYPYVLNGVNRKIIHGYVDGTFKPANQVNFAESLKMGLVAAEADFESIEYQDFHYEIKEEDWFAKHFKFGYDKHLFDLDLSGDIDPYKPMNRGDFVELLYRIANLDMNDPEAEFDISYNWQETVAETGLAIKYPLNWEEQKIEDGVLLGYFGDGEVNFVDIGEDSATTGIFHWVNKDKQTTGAYFSDLEKEYNTKYGKGKVKILSSNSEYGPSLRLHVPSAGVLDNYIFTSEDQILTGQGRYDPNSKLAAQFQTQIIETYDEIRFLSLSKYLSNDEKLEIIREYLLVEGEGTNMLDLFEEKELFETDTLGVGTGPVDYYYVQEINYTLKYERSNNMLLDIMEEKTSSF